MAKTRAIPSLHRDSFSAKVPGLCPVLASDNTAYLYCRAVSGNAFKKMFHYITSTIFFSLDKNADKFVIKRQNHNTCYVTNVKDK